MKKIYPYLALLLLSALTAYWSTMPKTNRTEESEEQVQVWDAGSKELDFLAYKSADVTVEISKKKFEGGFFYWGSIKKHKENSEIEFLLSNKFEEYLKKFQPLIATRIFKEVNDAKLKEFALFDAKVNHLSYASSKGKKLNLELGNKGFGGELTYSREENARVVWLLPRDLYDDLENLDGRYFENSFFEAATDDIKSIDFMANNKTKKILHTGKDLDGSTGWQTVEASGNSKNPGFKNWFDRFLRLRVVAYPELASLEKVKVRFAEKILDLQIDSGQAIGQKLEFFSSKDNQDFVFVVSNLKPVIYRISKAKLQPLIDEYQKLLGF